MFNFKTVKSLSALIIAIVSALLFEELALLFLATIGLLIIWIFATSYTKASAPNVIIGNLLALACTVTLFLTIGINELVNLFIAMLLQANCLKLLVAKTSRQIKSIILINFFISCCVFLFYQSLPATVLVLCLFLLNTTALYLLTNRKLAKHSGVGTLKILLLSLPITAVLFLFLPKLPAFWRMPSLSSAQVGLSESVNPFNISDLTKSDKLAFRAVIPSALKAPYYWRTMVHEEFDGRSWNIVDSAELKLNHVAQTLSSEPVKIYHEQTSLNWLPSLFVGNSNSPTIYTTIDGGLYKLTTNNQKFTYVVNQIDFPTRISLEKRTQNLALPNNLNRQTQALASQLKAQSTSPAHFVQLLANYYVQHGFTYTLKPPIYNGKNAIDDFIFDGQQGFCGHFASSSAFIFRAAGIPARVASGYLGGETSNNSEYLSVYQYDAHAWTEVWLPEQGWVKFDATAFVEPDRLYGSLSQLDTTRDDFEENVGLGLTALSEIAIFNQLRLYLEQLDYQWTAWVLSFDNEKQNKLLKELIEDVSAIKIAIIVMSLIGIFLVSFLIIKLWQRRMQLDDPIAEYLVALERFAKGKHLPRGEGETVSHFITRLCEHFPNNKTDFMSFLVLYSRYRYGEKPLTKAQIKKLKRNVNNIKYKRQL